MRVLQVLPDLKKNGGVEQGMIAWVERHPDMLWVASAGGALAERIKHHITLPLSTKNPWKMWLNVKRLTSVMLDHHISLVHVRSRAPAWSVMWACKRAGIPWIATYHGLYNASNLVKKWYNSIMTRGQTVIAISDWVAQHIKKNYPKAHITTIYGGINVSSFKPTQNDMWRRTWREKLNIADSQKVVLLPGRLTRLKGHHVLFEAARGLDNRWVIVLLGDAQKNYYAKELSQIAATLPVRVIFLPGGDDVRFAYAGADVIVSCSTDPEAFGRITAEALAMERPYIGTNHGGTIELTQNGKFGLLVPPGDALALREALVADDCSTKGAHPYIQQHYNEERMHQEMLNLYKSILNESLDHLSQDLSSHQNLLLKETA